MRRRRGHSDDSEFYCFSDALSNTAFRGRASQADFSLLWSAIRADKIPETPIRVTQDSGRVPRDFLWVSTIPLVHERVTAAWREAGLRGWVTFPVEVLDRKDRVVPGYEGLAITGRCESVAVNEDEVEYLESPGGWFAHFRGLRVATESWDGSDIFVGADGKTGFRIVTRRMAELLRGIGATNYRLEAVADLRMSAPGRPAVVRDRRQGSMRLAANTLVEEPLPAAFGEEVRELAEEGAAMLGVGELPPDAVVEAISENVDENRPLDGEALLDRALALGYLWGEQVRGAAGWSWVGLVDEGGRRDYALVPMDRAVALFPATFLRRLLENETLPNNSILLFRMVCAGRLPPVAAGSYLNLE